MPDKTKKIIAVDLDDVLSASAEEFVRFSNEKWGTNLEVDDYHEDWAQMWQVDRQTEVERSRAIYSSQLIRHFKPYHPYAEKELKNLAKNYKLIILTSRASVLRDGTIEWLDKHYPDIFKEVHMTGFYDTYLDGAAKDDSMHKRTKGEMLSEIGADYLIDDQPKHCLAAAETGVNTVLFGSYRWGRELKELPKGVTRCLDWHEVEKYFANQHNSGAAG